MKDRYIVIVLAVFAISGVAMVYAMHTAYLAYEMRQAFSIWKLVYGSFSAIVWGLSGIVLINLTSPIVAASPNDTYNERGESG